MERLEYEMLYHEKKMIIELPVSQTQQIDTTMARKKYVDLLNVNYVQMILDVLNV